VLLEFSQTRQDRQVEQRTYCSQHTTQSQKRREVWDRQEADEDKGDILGGKLGLDDPYIEEGWYQKALFWYGL
jgi:hypothetical protein